MVKSTRPTKNLNWVRMHPDATIIANGDAPIFNSVELPNPVIYYGFDHRADHDQKAPANTDGLLCPNANASWPIKI